MATKGATKAATVVVVFWSRLGSTERLALAAAVGAVQSRANIRLRWLREDADDAVIDSTPGWRDNRERMSQEYIAPRDIDLEWDGLILVTPAHRGADSVEWRAFFDQLRRVRSPKEDWQGDTGAALVASGSPQEFHQQLAQAKWTVLTESPDDASKDELERARLLGRRVGEACLAAA
jgi:multimeric flavodoxin WrbA